MTLVGSEPLADARLKIQSGKAPPLKRVDDRTFVTRWTLREATTLEVWLTSREDRPGLAAGVPVGRPASRTASRG